MTTTAFKRLRAADPVAGLDPPAPEDLLAQLTSRPRPTPAGRPLRRATPRRTVAIGGLAAAALAGAAVLGDGSSDAPGPSLLAKAYAQATAGEQVIQYSRITGRQEFRSPDRRREDVTRIESWVFGERVRTIITSVQEGKTFVSDQVLGSDGVLSIHLQPGDEEQVVRVDDDETRKVIARMRRGFLTNFTVAYRRGTLDRRGPATFGGRPAQRYVVARGWLDHPETFYVDAETGTPLGSTQSFSSHSASQLKIGPDRKLHPTGKPDARTSITTTVEALDELPPTPQNRARLTR